MSSLSPSTPCTVTVTERDITVQNLILADEDCASFLRQQLAEAWPEICRRGMKVGLLCLRDAEMVSRADFVRHEFERIKNDAQLVIQQAQATVQEQLKNLFGGDGQRGRIYDEMGKYIGEEGSLAGFFNDADTAKGLGKLKSLIEKELTGDKSTLRGLFNPDDKQSIYGRLLSAVETSVTNIATQFRTAIEVQRAVHVIEEETALKGQPFEEQVSRALESIGSSFGDRIDDTRTVAGAVPGSKEGDYVATLRTETGPTEARIAIQVTRQPKLYPKAAADEINTAKANRRAAAGILVLGKLDQSPFGVVLRQIPEGYVVVFDKETLDPLPLQLAYCAARLDALRTIPGMAQASQEAIQKASNILLETQRRLNELSGFAGNITKVQGALEGIKTDLTNLRKELRDKINESLILLGGTPLSDVP